MNEEQSRNDIDNIFREGIEPLSTEPSEKFWRRAAEDIVSRTSKSAARRTLKRRAIVLLLGAGLLFLGYFIYKMQTALNNVEQQVATIKNAQNKMENQPSPAPETIHSTPTADVNKSGTTKPDELLKQSTKDNDNNDKPQATPLALNKLVPSNHQDSPAESIATNSKQETASFEQENNTIIPPASVATPESRQENMGDVKQESTANNSTPVNPLSSGQPLPQTSTGNNKSINAPDTAVKVSNTNPAISTENSKAEEAANTVVVSKPSSSRFSVSALFSPDFMLGYKVENNNSWGSPYGGATQLMEKQNFSYSAGARLEYKLSSRFAISAGLGYQKFSFSLAPGTVYAQKQPNGDVGYYLITSSGVVKCPYYGITYVGDSLKMNASSTRTYLEIPVLAKYSFITNEQYNFYVNGGVETNVSLSESTTMNWQNFYNEHGVATVSNTQGSSTMYFSYYIGVGASYNVSRYFSFFIEPGLNNAITSVDELAPVISYPRLLSVNAGLTYHIK